MNLCYKKDLKDVCKDLCNGKLIVYKLKKFKGQNYTDSTGYNDPTIICFRLQKTKVAVSRGNCI